MPGSRRPDGALNASLRRALIGQVVLQIAGYAAMLPMASFRALELGASGTQVGALAASFALLPFLFAFTIGRQIDRRGPVRFMITGNLMVVTAAVLAAIAPNLGLLYAAATVIGLGHLFGTLGHQSVAAGDTSISRDRSFGRLGSAAALGQIVGPPAASFAAQHWTGAASEARIGLCVGAGLTLMAAALAVRISFLRRPAPSAARAASASRRVAIQLIRTPGMWQALLASGVVLAALDLLAAFLPLWATERDVPIGVVGSLLATRALVTMLSRIGSERLIRRFGRRQVLAVSLVVGAIGLVALPFVGVAGAAVVMVALGIGLGLAQPLTMTLVAEAAAPGTSTAALGMRLSANRLGQAALPVTVAAIMAGSGASGVFWGAAVLLSVAAGTAARAPESGGTGSRAEP